MGKFKIGDRVIFRLGERENLECDECDWQLWNTEEEQFLQDRSNQLYRIFSISDTSFAVACPRCHLRVNNRIEGIPILSLKYEHYINGRYYLNSWRDNV